MTTAIAPEIIAKEWTAGEYRMIASSGEVADRRFKLLHGKSGRRWLVSAGECPGDFVYVEDLNPNRKGFQGFGGRTLTFRLEDGGEVRLKGPWQTGPGELFKDTGHDVRNRMWGFVVIGLGREYRENRPYCPVTITDILYKEEPHEGTSPYARAQKLGRRFANELGRSVMTYSKSHDGSSCGPVDPEATDDAP